MPTSPGLFQPLSCSWLAFLSSEMYNHTTMASIKDACPNERMINSPELPVSFH